MTYNTKLVYCIVIFGSKVKKGCGDNIGIIVKKGCGHSSLEHMCMGIVKSEKKVSRKKTKLVFNVIR